MQKELASGSCLCGEVAFRITGEAKVFQYCHCSRCRKFTGSAHAANIIVAPENFEWSKGESLVGRYELENTHHFATCFCTRCGSSLPWMTQSKKSVVIPAGTLDQDPGIRPRHNIFYKDKAPWYVDVCELTKYDELPTR